MLSQALQRATELVLRDQNKWYYLFNLALLRVAAGDADGAEQMYIFSLQKYPPLNVLDAVLKAQNIYLDSFPEDELMSRMRKYVLAARGKAET